MRAAISARGVSVYIGARAIIAHVDLDIAAGELLAIVGPNGAGKSTLIKALAGDIKPSEGAVTLNGRPISEWTLEERARQRAVLPQRPELAFSFRAFEVVELGRHPHRGHTSLAENNTAVIGAMAAADVLEFADRDCRTLSGGESHCVHFARALAQLWQPLNGMSRVLLLDEPTSSLDLFHQHAILTKALEIARAGTAVVAVLHDINLAAAYADRIAVMDRGCLDSAGSAEEILTVERIGRIWRVDCDVISGGKYGRPQVAVRPWAHAASNPNSQPRSPSLA